MAGLTAAFRLSQWDHDVTVLEARQRVGGRVYSVTLENGSVAELGGEWITDGQRSVLRLALELRVSMSPVGVDFAKRNLMGSPPITEGEHRRVADMVLDRTAAMSEAELNSQTAAHLLTDLDDGSIAFTVLRQRIAGSAGVPLTSVAVDETLGDFGIEETTYLRVDGGNQILAEALASRLADVRMGEPVIEIKSTVAGVDIQAMDDTITAEGVVVAVPLPLLSKLRFSPPLGDELAHALDKLAMGTAAKIAVSTESVPGLFALQNPADTWWCWTGAGAGGAARKVVTAFAGTQQAIEAVGPSWRDRMAAALPDVELGSDAVMIDWGREEWSRGCYTALGPGDEDLLPVFEEPGRIVFAGEHTLGAGTIDGAIESGDLAAKRLVGFLSRAK